MAKANVVASVTVDGLTYTATIDRSSKAARPTTIERDDGQRWTGEWESAMAYVCLDEGEIPEAAHVALNEALDNALKAR